MALRDYVEASHGHVDIIFANAGMATFAPLGQVTEEAFDLTVSTNLKGTFFTVQALLPLMRDGGSIILSSSIAAGKGMPSFSVYSATKAAIRSLARTSDLEQRRIRVNALSPGTIVTPIGEAAGLSRTENEAYLERTAAETPLGRNGDPHEIAAAALFLASSDSGFVTGIELAIDGGYAQI